MVIPRYYILTWLNGREGAGNGAYPCQRWCTIHVKNNCWVSWAREGHGHEGEKIETQS